MTDRTNEDSEAVEISTGCMIKLLCAVFIPYLLICLSMAWSGLSDILQQSETLEVAQKIQALVLESESRSLAGHGQSFIDSRSRRV